MSLVKFDALQPGIGECWLNLLAVDSIWPLRGVPTSVPLAEIRDISQTEVIGCRVAVGPNTFELAVSHDELAAAVREAIAKAAYRIGRVRLIPGTR
jgi:hypothetical protein